MMIIRQWKSAYKGIQYLIILSIEKDEEKTL